MSRTVSGLLVALCMVCSIPSASAKDRVGIYYEYIKDIKDADVDRTNDKIVSMNYKQVYLTGYLGEFQEGVEVGGFVKDARKSAYSAMIRLRERDRTYQIGTEQVLSNGYVLKGRTQFVRLRELEEPDDKSDLWVFGLGFDKYYGDYNYFSLEAVNDPRESHRASLIVSHTFATENSLLRIGLVPRTDGTIGGFAVIKYHWLIAAFASTREFDFTTTDRKSYTIGLEIPFDGKW